MSNKSRTKGKTRLRDEEEISTPEDGLPTLDDHVNSLYDPITISVYPPSTTYPSPHEDRGRSSLSSPPISPSIPNIRHSLQSQPGGPWDPSLGASAIEEDVTTVNPSTSGRPVANSPSMSSGRRSGSTRSRLNEDARSIHSTAGRLEGRSEVLRSFNTTTPVRWSEAPSSPSNFTTIDPFARKKHRLSWSSILSVKDSKKRQDHSQQAWTSPVLYASMANPLYLEEEEDDFPIHMDTDGAYTLEGVPMESARLRHDIHMRDRPHSFPVGAPSSFPRPQTPVAPRPHSASSESPTSSYHSFDEDKIRRTVIYQEDASMADRRPHSFGYNEKIQPTMRPVPHRQTTQTTLETLRFQPSPPEEPEDTSILSLIGKYLPARAYVYFLLGLPSIYFTRVATIFQDANLSIKRMEVMVLENASARRRPELHSFRDPAYERLTKSWTEFIDTLIREWKTINLISVLLLSAIVGILQIEGAFLDPVVHWSALFSLVSALVSLLFGCMYILRFNTMRMPHKAIQWAQETQKENANRFWNVWILLAIPAVWLVWSLIFYIVCIMSFVWRVESGSPPPQFSEKLKLAIRIGISIALSVGIVYGAVVVRTFMNFGAPMDARFQKQVESWIAQKSSTMAHLKNNPDTHAKIPSTLGTNLRSERPDWFQSQVSNVYPSNMSIRSRASRYSAHVSAPMGEAPVVLTENPTGRPKDPRVRFEDSLGEGTVQQKNSLPPDSRVPPTRDLREPYSAMQHLPTSHYYSQTQRNASPARPSLRRLPTRKVLTSPNTSNELTARANESLLTMGMSLDSEHKNPPQFTAPSLFVPLADHSTADPTTSHSSDAGEVGINLRTPAGQIGRPNPISRPSPSSSMPVFFDLNSEGASSYYLNDAPYPVSYKGLEYRTVAYLFAAMPYLGNHPALAEQVRTCGDSGERLELSDRFARYRRPDWDEVFLEQLEEALLLKFQQHLELGVMLLDTGQRYIVYSEMDSFWGVGKNARGRNKLGKALMKVRERLRALDQYRMDD